MSFFFAVVEDQWFVPAKDVLCIEPSPNDGHAVRVKLIYTYEFKALSQTMRGAILETAASNGYGPVVAGSRWGGVGADDSSKSWRRSVTLFYNADEVDAKLKKAPESQNGAKKQAEAARPATEEDKRGLAKQVTEMRALFETLKVNLPDNGEISFTTSTMLSSLDGIKAQMEAILGTLEGNGPSAGKPTRRQASSTGSSTTSSSPSVGKSVLAAASGKAIESSPSSPYSSILKSSFGGEGKGKVKRKTSKKKTKQTIGSAKPSHLDDDELDSDEFSHATAIDRQLSTMLTLDDSFSFSSSSDSYSSSDEIFLDASVMADTAVPAASPSSLQTALGVDVSLTGESSAKLNVSGDEVSGECESSFSDSDSGSCDSVVALGEPTPEPPAKSRVPPAKPPPPVMAMPPQRDLAPAKIDPGATEMGGGGAGSTSGSQRRRLTSGLTRIVGHYARDERLMPPQQLTMRTLRRAQEHTKAKYEAVFGVVALLDMHLASGGPRALPALGPIEVFVELLALMASLRAVRVLAIMASPTTVDLLTAVMELEVSKPQDLIVNLAQVYIPLARSVRTDFSSEILIPLSQSPLIPSIIEHAERAPTSAALNEVVLVLMSWLAYDMRFRTMFADASSDTIAIRALNTFSNERTILKAAFKYLYLVCDRESVRERCGGDGLRGLIEAVNDHLDDARIAEYALAAMGQVVLNVELNLKFSSQPHGKNAAVMAQLIQLIRRLCGLADVRPLFRTKGESKILVDAINTFPNDMYINKDAEWILRVLCQREQRGLMYSFPGVEDAMARARAMIMASNVAYI
ncbi:uncharacterized protein AMSG_10277 [Thecamonas trahens ATCC 50062]|uniref:Uncharacterized protein n=1 Tax=Thecamonas trahens ATCC 50062 TaxID=461836 RepID=A0A0L0DPS0_THETB|nr:hypothetical protein AMSG_10277 [Thecamonas trahens ATCC 50062]KNC54297.1 hypothetical protein AMSG_10277 [Thecamonas trahens ATCC 50062]|eukprot:XP_013753761.1 hypothetical protein AMSG_10277 [Thecamonas trahens ATCC 50062]